MGEGSCDRQMAMHPDVSRTTLLVYRTQEHSYHCYVCIGVMSHLRLHPDPQEEARPFPSALPLMNEANAIHIIKPH